MKQSAMLRDPYHHGCHTQNLVVTVGCRTSETLMMNDCHLHCVCHIATHETLNGYHRPCKSLADAADMRHVTSASRSAVPVASHTKITNVVDVMHTSLVVT